MATKRAFNILEQRNINENSHIGKTPLPGKNASRAPFKSALKDLTNSSASKRPNFTAGKQSSEGASALKKSLQQQKPVASSISRKKLSESTVTQPTGNKRQNVAAPLFPIFSPLDAEYSWGKEACLREDLLEQMIDYHGATYKREIKPMKPLKVEPLELPELEIPRPEVAKSNRATVKDGFPASFLFNLQEVDIPDLEFMF
ncbi:uncharacterized protein LOC109621977 [Aedes albopictus]|uniref:Protein phosphatase 1 regulatory subunit 35 C-terminal domain-containing protein n=1 Tax=Aedes albopictus TaxID=7160 RepID=A0ABM1ZQW4_AEDAL|nr:uncharacterized protein LOC109621977 [Aedes albopictus]